MRPFLFILFIATLIISCNNSGKKVDPKKDTVVSPPPTLDSISSKPGVESTGTLGESKTLKMTFSSYDEGDYAHTIFKETASGREWDFGHPEENNLNGIAIVLEDKTSGWGYKTNPKMQGQSFIVQVVYKTLDGSDLDGDPIKYNDWRITDLKEDK
jgi:hypothetical protein